MKQLWEKIVSMAGSNFGLKVLALVIAVGLWIAGHRDTERALEVPVEFRNLPADLVVLDNRIDYVVLRLMGPRTLVSTIDSDDLRLLIDLTGAKSGAVSYPLGASSFNIPRGVSVARITPPVVHLRLEPVVHRSLPVSVKLAGKPAAGYQVARAIARPENVSVSGPAEEVRRMTAVETLPVDFDEKRGVDNRKVRLSTDGKPLSIMPEQVEVSVTIEEEEASRDFADVRLRAKDFHGAYTAIPAAISLRLAGAKSIIDKLELTGEEVYLELKGLPAGEHALPVSFDLPVGVRVVEQKPARVRVRIIKPGN
jgi:YbbR domain-containing protein